MSQELGPRQLAWVEALEAHPERQMTGSLGEGNTKSYKACCLGEACIVKARLTKKSISKLKKYLITQEESLRN